MSARLDDELDERTEGRFDRHVGRCRRCAQVLDSLRRTLGLLRETAEDAPSFTNSVIDDVLGRISAPLAAGPRGSR